MEIPTVPQNIRLKTSLAHLKTWIQTLDHDDALAVAAPIDALIDLSIAYPNATDQRDRLLRWLEVEENTGWDPAWRQIFVRISVFIVVMERGYLRPLSPQPPITEAEAAARERPATAKFRADWLALRGQALSPCWLAHAFVEDTQPLGPDVVAFPEVLRTSKSPFQSKHPGLSAAAWLETLNDSDFRLVAGEFRHFLPPLPGPRANIKDVRRHYADWISGADCASKPFGQGVIYDRILILAHVVEMVLRHHFNGRSYDRTEQRALKLKSGELSYKELLPSEYAVPESELKAMADFIIAELETLPARRAGSAKDGAAWDALCAGELSESAVRSWCLRPA